MLSDSQQIIFRWNRAALIEAGKGTMIAFSCILAAFSLLILLQQVQVVAVEVQPGLLVKTLAFMGSMAIVEELIFRVGLLLGLLKLTRRVWLAVVIQALLFGFAHAWNPGATYLTVLSNSLGGVMYALAFVRTARFWMPLFLHIAWNFGQAVTGFNISGMNSYSRILVHLVPLGPAAWSGGQYGLEGSWAGIIARLAVIGLTLLWTRQRVNR